VTPPAHCSPHFAPLIPPRARPGAREHGRTAAPVRRLPVAAPEVPTVPDDMVYGFGRIDESGRVGDRAMIGVLGWQPGDRLTLTASAGMVIARRDPGGMVTMTVKPYLVIPAALRHRCGLRPGNRVLLAVFPARDDSGLRDRVPERPPGRPPRTGPRRAPSRAGPSGPGPCWSWPPGGQPTRSCLASDLTTSW